MHSSRMRTVRSSSRLLGGVSAPSGVSARGGVCPQGGLLLGGGIPACTEADSPPCGQTDRCKNITFVTSLRTVIIGWRTPPLPRELTLPPSPPPREILDLPLIPVCITSTFFNFARSYCWLPLPSALLSVVFTILMLGMRLQFVRRFEGVADTCLKRKII